MTDTQDMCAPVGLAPPTEEQADGLDELNVIRALEIGLEAAVIRCNGREPEYLLQIKNIVARERARAESRVKGVGVIYRVLDLVGVRRIRPQAIDVEALVKAIKQDMKRGDEEGW